MASAIPGLGSPSSQASSLTGAGPSSFVPQLISLTHSEGASGAGLNKKLMNELAESGVKYNVDDVVMITKNSDGKLFWLEKGTGFAGLKHIVDRHEVDFVAKGVNDIPKFLSDVLKTKAIKVGTGVKGPFAEYIVNETRYRVAYGTNGYIVSFYPID